jgi:DNA mismatch endonuclease (patch repair protein)
MDRARLNNFGTFEFEKKLNYNLKMDVLTLSQRKYCMSKIRSKNTNPEKVVRAVVRALGYRYSLNSELPGKPDMKIIGHPVVIFVDGCFWHRCPKHFNIPQTNRNFWLEKIGKNRVRDTKVKNLLVEKGYKVIRIWEHEIKNPARLMIDLRRRLNSIISR